MNSSTIIKIIGIGATVLGLVASVANTWVADKKMDEKIGDAVNKALQSK